MSTIVKRSLYFNGEFVSDKRLFDNPCVADFLKCGIVHITRHKHQWKRWKLGMNLSCQIHAIHAGHRKVQHYQINTRLSA